MMKLIRRGSEPSADHMKVIEYTAARKADMWIEQRTRSLQSMV